MIDNLIIAVIAAVGFGWSYYRLFKGTGLVIGVVLEIVVGLAVLKFSGVGIWAALGLGITAFLLEVRHHRQRKQYLSGRMTFEGGGIRRGLSPVEVGMLFRRSNGEILQLGLIEALGEGTIRLLEGDGVGFKLADHLRISSQMINPVEKREARKKAGRDALQVISPTDDILLELVRQYEGKPAREMPANIWLEKVKEETEFAMTGFDLEQTLEYYDAFITHRLMGVAGDHFEADEYLGWMLLAEQARILEPKAVAAVAGKIKPDWLPEGDLREWLDELEKAIHRR
jgi:hypothetical protein